MIRGAFCGETPLCCPGADVSSVPVQTQLPQDYLELEKRVDALKLMHQKLLQVTYGSNSIPPSAP